MDVAQDTVAAGMPLWGQDHGPSAILLFLLIMASSAPDVLPPILFPSFPPTRSSTPNACVCPKQVAICEDTASRV